MFRIAVCFAVLVASISLIGVDAGDLKKKKQPDLSVFSGKITDVNVDETTKKIESIYIQPATGKKGTRRSVRVNEKTKFEYAGFANKADEKPRVGDTAEGKIDPVSDYAINVKITAVEMPKKKK